MVQRPAAFNIGAAENRLDPRQRLVPNQWMGVNGAPVTTMLNLHTKVDLCLGPWRPTVPR